uniref:phosphoribosyl-ATP diphosphatase n=1 Tax=Staphylococcus epidermidis TaxID=1282 RepID=UPI00119F39C2
LPQTIHQTPKTNQSNSYTQYLLNEPIHKISNKFGEQAFQLLIPPIKHNPQELINQTPHLIYHLFLLLHSLHIPFSQLQHLLPHPHQKTNNFKAHPKNVQQS